jgi:predicted MPP superfamily phosphohydrolase
MFKSKVIGAAFFIAFFLFVDLYVWQGVKLLIKNSSSTTKKIAFGLYWGYTIGMIAFFAFARFVPHAVGPLAMRFVGSLAFSILIVKVLWVVFLLIDDSQRIIRWFGKDILNKDKGVETIAVGEGIPRSKFLNYLGLGIGLLFLGSSIWGVVKGAHNYVVRRRKLRIKNLPNEFKGLKIVQISDIHCGSFWSREAVERGVELINKQNADIVFFTGDLVNDTSKEAEPWLDVFGKIKAKEGVFSILGNHDYGDYVQWESGKAKLKNLQEMYDHHASMGWELLLDENRVIERNGQKMAIIGVQNWSAKGRFPKYGDLKKALAGTELASVKLLLSHDPSHWREQVLGKTDVDAMFSGHTHGMQFGVDSKFYKWSPVKYLYKEWLDLYKEGEQYLYVNRGFGYLGYPGRMGIFPEITVFTLD